MTSPRVEGHRPTLKSDQLGAGGAPARAQDHRPCAPRDKPSGQGVLASGGRGCATQKRQVPVDDGQ